VDRKTDARQNSKIRIEKERISKPIPLWNKANELAGSKSNKTDLKHLMQRNICRSKFELKLW